LSDPRSDLTAYVQGELSEDREREIEALLAGDPELRREMESISALLVTFHALPTVEPSARLERELQAAFTPAVSPAGPGFFGTLLLLPAFLRFHLRESRGLRRLGFVTAAFGLHAIALTVLELRRAEPDLDVASLPREVVIPIAPLPDAEGVLPDLETRVGETPRPTLDPIDLEDDLVPIREAAFDDPGAVMPPPLRFEIETLNQRALRRLDLVARYDVRQRQRHLAAFGAGPESDGSVEKALDWLVRSQSTDGSWHPEQTGGYPENRAGVTALALLAFLGHGSSSTFGPHREVVARGVTSLERWLEEAPADRPLHAHALATLALLEDSALVSAEPTPGRRRILLDSLQLIASTRNTDGGWGYRAEAPSDLGSSVWQILTLTEARRMGFPGAPSTLQGYLTFLSRRAARTESLSIADNGDSGWGRLGPSGGELGSEGRLAAAALLSVFEARLALEAEIQVRLVEERHAAVSSLDVGARDYNLAFFLETGDARMASSRPRDGTLRDRLLGWQESDGSFSPEGDPFGPAGGRVWATALATLALEAPYR